MVLSEIGPSQGQTHFREDLQEPNSQTDSRTVGTWGWGGEGVSIYWEQSFRWEDKETGRGRWGGCPTM